MAGIKNVFRRFPLLSFLTLTYLLNWGGMAGHVAGVIPPLGQWSLKYHEHLIAVIRGRRTLMNWTPNIAAIIVIGATHGWAGSWHLLRRFFNWRGTIKIWLVALLLPAGCAMAAVLGHGLLTKNLNLKFIQDLPAVFLLRNVFSLTTGGFGEEGGWRGFALVLMQKRINPLLASLVLGLAWAPLHAPMWWIKQMPTTEILLFVFIVLCLSVWLTWFYNQSGSLLIVAVVHNLFNAVDATLSSSYAALLPHQDYQKMFFFVLGLATIFLVIATKGEIGLSTQGALHE